MPTPNPLQDFSEQLVAVSCQVDAYKADPSQAGLLANLRKDALAVARSLVALQSLSREDACVGAVLGLGLQLQEAGALDYEASAEANEFVSTHTVSGWRGIVASLLVAAPWQWRKPIPVDQLPTWLWTPYARICSAAPQGFCTVGQADRYAQFMTAFLEQVSRLVQANRGSAAVRGLLTVVVEKLNCVPLYFNDRSLRSLYEARARIYSVAASVPKPEIMPAFPREGRRLRIGFLNRHFGPQTETYTTIPSFEHLDPERFEVFLFACHETGERLETYVRSLPLTWVLLPSGVDDQLGVLRSYALDVLVFGTNTTATLNEVSRLALFRSASLQVVNNSSCTTSGMPELDLYVSGRFSENDSPEAHYSERLALLPSAAHAFNYLADYQEPTVAPSRAALGIPEDAFLFVSGANYHKTIPEMMEAWAGILASVPGSYLLIHPFNPNWSAEYPIKRFCALFDGVLAARGIDSARLVVSANRFPSRTDVVKLLSLGSVYLDTFPFGGVNSVIDALEQSMPVIAWEGTYFRSRMGAALLREIGLADCIVSSAADYSQLAISLATDPERLASVRARLSTAMGRAPRFMDMVASSEDFGALMEQAYDELVELGTNAAFRAKRTPLVLKVPSASGLSEHVEAARSLLSTGRAERAVVHLMAAIEHAEADGPVWFLLAQTLRDAGKLSESVKALETALRLDPYIIEAWLMLVEITESLGVADMASDAAHVLRSLAPEDPRVAVILSRYPASVGTPSN